MPLNQVASLSVPEPTLIVAQPFDPSLMSAIERGIQKANLGLNPASDGKVVRMPIPSLTDERRKEMSRLVHKYAEEGRNVVRQVRRDANDRLKKLLKDHKISEDDERRALDEVQKITDQHVSMIDDLQKKKDQELLGQMTRVLHASRVLRSLRRPPRRPAPNDPSSVLVRRAPARALRPRPRCAAGRATRSRARERVDVAVPRAHAAPRRRGARDARRGLDAADPRAATRRARSA